MLNPLFSTDLSICTLELLCYCCFLRIAPAAASISMVFPASANNPSHKTRTVAYHKTGPNVKGKLQEAQRQVQVVGLRGEVRSRQPIGPSLLVVAYG